MVVSRKRPQRATTGKKVGQYITDQASKRSFAEQKGKKFKRAQRPFKSPVLVHHKRLN